MQTITPHLWYDKEAREAAEFYTTLLPNSSITNVTTLHNTPSGDCDVVSFTLWVLVSGNKRRALLQVQSLNIFHGQLRPVTRLGSEGAARCSMVEARSCNTSLMVVQSEPTSS